MMETQLDEDINWVIVLEIIAVSIVAGFDFILHDQTGLLIAFLLLMQQRAA